MHLKSSLLLIFSFSTLAISRGEVGYQYTSYLKDKSGQEKHLSTIKANVEESGEKKGIEYKMSLTGTAEREEKDTAYFVVNDLFASKQFDSKKLTLGFKTFNWSQTEAFHPADVLNSRIITGDVENFEKRGEPIVSLDVEFDKGTLSFIYMPLFQENVLPDARSRVIDGFKPQKYRIVKGNRIVDEKHQNQFAITFEGAAFDDELEYFVYGMKHIDRNRSVAGWETYGLTGGVGEIATYYLDTLDVGGNATYVKNGHIFKVEGIYSKFNTADRNILTPIGLRKFVDYGHAVVAYEYPYTFEEKGYDLNIFLEYARVLNVTKETSYELSIFQNDIFLGGRLVFNDKNSKELFMGVYYDLDRDGEMLMALKYEQRINQHWKGTAGFRGFRYNSTDSLGLFSLDGDDQLYFKLTRFF